MKGFALGLALKQRQKATRKSPIGFLPRIAFAFVGTHTLMKCPLRGDCPLGNFEFYSLLLLSYSIE